MAENYLNFTNKQLDDQVPSNLIASGQSLDQRFLQPGQNNSMGPGGLNHMHFSKTSFGIEHLTTSQTENNLNQDPARNGVETFGAKLPTSSEKILDTVPGEHFLAWKAQRELHKGKGRRTTANFNHPTN